MNGFYMYNQFIKNCRQFRNTFKVFIFFLDTRQSPAETRLGLYIIAHGKIKIPQFNLANRFFQSVLSTFLNAQFIILYRIRRIFPVQIDISQRVIHLIQIVFILIVLRHPVEHLDNFLIVSTRKDFRLTDTGGKFQFVRRAGFSYFVKHFISQSVLILCSINLP